MAKEIEKVEEVEEVEESAKGVQQARAAVSEKLGVAKDKLGEVSQAAGKRLQEVKGQAGQATQVAREKAAEGLKQGYDRVRKDFDDLNADVNAYVKDNPGRSVLIAAGVGFLLGMMMRRDR
jgi:ElaB/YqjD/DUF883 family membrane-anchored ribosome-binding protein